MPSGRYESLGAFARIRELLELALESDYDVTPAIPPVQI